MARWNMACALYPHDWHWDGNFFNEELQYAKSPYFYFSFLFTFRGALTLLTGICVFLLHWWFPVGTGMVFLHDAQLEDVEEKYHYYSKDFLEIDTVSML